MDQHSIKVLDPAKGEANSGFGEFACRFTRRKNRSASFERPNQCCRRPSHHTGIDLCEMVEQPTMAGKCIAGEVVSSSMHLLYEWYFRIEGHQT